MRAMTLGVAALAVATLTACGGATVDSADVSESQATQAAETAGAADGLLPVFLVAGEAVWREATGKGFALRVRPDPAALLGYRAEGIGAGTFCTVALGAMEAIAQAQADEPDRLLVNGLIGSVWQAVLDRAGPPAGTPAAVAAAPLPSRTGASP